MKTHKKGINSSLKTVLVFQNGNLINQITYKTKTLAKKHYMYFKKHGMADAMTGETIKNSTFELL